MTYGDDWMLRSEVNGVLNFWNTYVHCLCRTRFRFWAYDCRKPVEPKIGRNPSWHSGRKCNTFSLRLDFDSHESGLENCILLRFCKTLVFENEWREIIAHSRCFFADRWRETAKDQNYGTRMPIQVNGVVPGIALQST